MYSYFLSHLMSFVEMVKVNHAKLSWMGNHWRLLELLLFT